MPSPAVSFVYFRMASSALYSFRNSSSMFADGRSVEMVMKSSQSVFCYLSHDVRCGKLRQASIGPPQFSTSFLGAKSGVFGYSHAVTLLLNGTDGFRLGRRRRT